jgi:L-lactate dehydrogenase complex protein LldG
MAIDDNERSREAVLARVRAALGPRGPNDTRRAAADAYIAARRRGPIPSLPMNLARRFEERATDMESSVERVATVDAVARAVARYLQTIDDGKILVAPDMGTPGREHADAADVARLEDGGARQGGRPVLSPSPVPETPAGRASGAGAARFPAGVCWPEFGALGWAAAGLSIESRPTLGHDPLGVTGCFCAIAETGTLVFLTGIETPSATFLLPETHIAIVRVDQVVASMEDAFARIRTEREALPRAVNLVSGPSRTGDIEQTIVLGAHGPRRLHIVLVG